MWLKVIRTKEVEGGGGKDKEASFFTLLTSSLQVSKGPSSLLHYTRMNGAYSCQPTTFWRKCEFGHLKGKEEEGGRLLFVLYHPEEGLGNRLKRRMFE